MGGGWGESRSSPRASPSSLNRNGRGSVMSRTPGPLARSVGPRSAPLLLWLEPDGQELRESRAVARSGRRAHRSGPRHRLGLFDEVVQ